MDSSYRPRVAQFHSCQQKDCKGFEDGSPHLLVKTKEVALQQGHAHAISYAWGEFARRKRHLGHFEDGRPAEIELGEDWDLGDFRRTLRRLSLDEADRASQWCWIDQICIHQNDPEKVRQALDNIPNIFKTFEVCILIPGSRCSCFRRFNELVNRVEGSSSSRYEALGGESCLGLTSVYGWSTRIWTRQEMFYARKMRVVFTNTDLVDCDAKLKDTSQTKRGDLALDNTKTPWSKIEKLWSIRGYDKMINLQSKGAQSQGSGPNIDVDELYWGQKGFLTELAAAANLALNNLLLGLRAWYESHSLARASEESEGALVLDRLDCDRQAWKSVFALLAGETVTSPRWLSKADLQDSPQEKSRQIAVFLENLTRLRDMKLYASKPRDYVLAVWIDCPVYTVPSGYKSMSLGALLGNALRQLYLELGIDLSTRLPAALFGNLRPPHLWRPQEYIDQQPINAISDVYSSLNAAGLHYYSERVIRAMSQAVIYSESTGYLSNTLGKSTRISTYRYFNALLFGGEQFSTGEKDTWKQLRKSVQTLDTSTLQRLKGASKLSQGLSVRNDASAISNVLIAECLAADQLLSDVQLFGPMEPANPGLSKNPQVSQIFPGLSELTKVPLRVQMMRKLDLNKVAFNLMCQAVGIDPEVAKAKGIQLMVRDSPPMLGLTRRRLWRSDKSSSRLRFLMSIVPSEASGAATYKPNKDAHDGSSETRSEDIAYDGLGVPAEITHLLEIFVSMQDSKVEYSRALILECSIDCFDESDTNDWSDKSSKRLKQRLHDLSLDSVLRQADIVGVWVAANSEDLNKQHIFSAHGHESMRTKPITSFPVGVPSDSDGTCTGEGTDPKTRTGQPNSKTRLQRMRAFLSKWRPRVSVYREYTRPEPRFTDDPGTQIGTRFHRFAMSPNHMSRPQHQENPEERESTEQQENEEPQESAEQQKNAEPQENAEHQENAEPETESTTQEFEDAGPLFKEG